jgi:predicted RNA-binding protein with PUA-like domain
MATWLLKTEPSEYSYDALERDGRATWDGVANPVARKHLAAMRAGDLAVVYHTGKERRAVGLAEVVEPGEAPILAARKRLVKPVALEALKEQPLFATSPLVKMGRLSVVPLDAPQWKALLALAATKP